MRALVVSLSLLIASTGMAQPREEANHHLGDDSFVAAFGRSPSAGDSEKLRMRTHISCVLATRLTCSSTTAIASGS